MQTEIKNNITKEEIEFIDQWIRISMELLKYKKKKGDKNGNNTRD